MKTKNSNLIGISGKIGSGKNSVATIIQGLNSSLDRDVIVHHVQTNKPFSESSGYKQVAFADKLKDMVCILINCSREDLENREFKERELGEEWWYYLQPNGELMGYYSGIYYQLQGKLIKLTPRLLLQLLGTECGKEIIHPDIWVNSLFSKYKPVGVLDNRGYKQDVTIYPSWVITDVRFENELKAVKDRKGITIRVNRKLDRPLKIEEINSGFHPSETALDNAEFDYELNNNGTIEELIEKVKEILIKEQIL